MPEPEALDVLRRLFVHLEWADERALQALQQSPDPPADVVRIFSHLLASEHIWLSRMSRREPRLAVWPVLDAEACARQARENAGEIRKWVEELPPERLGETFRYTNTSGETYAPRIDDVLLHMCLHGSYHRGQIALLLRQNGLEPVPTDYVLFTRGERVL